MPEPPSLRRLRGEMLLVLLLFGFVPLILASAAGVVAAQAARETRMRNLLDAMVKNRKVTVALFLEEKMRELELATAAVRAAELARRDVLERLRDRMQHEHGGIIDLGFIASNGRHLAYIGPYDLAGRDYQQEAWFREVMVRGRHRSDVFLGFRRFPHMVMAVKKREAGRDYVLRATIDTEVLSSLVREGGLESGAEVFILNRAGEYQTQAVDHHRLMEKAGLPPLSWHSGVRIVDGTGRREIVATIWLDDGQWVLVARQALGRVSGVVDLHPAVLGVIALGFLVIPLLSWAIAAMRLRQFADVAAERAGLLESVAQSEKMAAIGRLAAGVAHEINNPLAIIQAQVGVLLERLGDVPGHPLSDEIRDRLRKVGAQVERGRKVTHRLLGFSRRVGPDVEPVDLAAALDETLGFVEKEAENLRIRIGREYDPEAPIVRSSLSQIQQVYLNLLNNAMDAVGHDGEIRLAVARVPGGVEVRIADNGPGIDEEGLTRLFEPFSTTKGAGTRHIGLGLSICREIMHNLGGRIGVESEVRKGTTFTLWFPHAPEGTDAAPGAVPPDPA